MNNNKIVMATEVLGEIMDKLALVATKESVINIQTMKKVNGDTVLYQTSFVVFNGKTQVACNAFAKSAELDAERVNFSLGYELIGAVKALAKAGEDTTIAQVTETTVEVVSGTARIVLNKKVEGVNPVVFDIMDKDSIEAVYDISTNAFKGAIEKVALTAETNEACQYAGICLDPVDGGFAARSTNGVMFGDSQFALLQEQARERKSIVLPAQIIKGMIQTVKGEQIRLYKTTHHTVIQTKTELWQLGLLESCFPSEGFSKIKAMPRPISITVKGADLNVALGIALATSDDSGKKLVSLITENGTVLVSNEAKTASAKVVPSEAVGEIPEIWLNASLIKTALSSFKEEEVVIAFDCAQRPISIKGKKDDKTIIVMTPVNHA